MEQLGPEHNAPASSGPRIGRPTIGSHAMTANERQQRHRANKSTERPRKEKRTVEQQREAKRKRDRERQQRLRAAARAEGAAQNADRETGGAPPAIHPAEPAHYNSEAESAGQPDRPESSAPASQRARITTSISLSVPPHINECGTSVTQRVQDISQIVTYSGQERPPLRTTNFRSPYLTRQRTQTGARANNHRFADWETRDVRRTASPSPTIATSRPIYRGQWREPSEIPVSDSEATQVPPATGSPGEAALAEALSGIRVGNTEAYIPIPAPASPEAGSEGGQPDRHRGHLYEEDHEMDVADYFGGDEIEDGYRQEEEDHELDEEDEGDKEDEEDEGDEEDEEDEEEEEEEEEEDDLGIAGEIGQESAEDIEELRLRDRRGVSASRSDTYRAGHGSSTGMGRNTRQPTRPIMNTGSTVHPLRTRAASEPIGVDPQSSGRVRILPLRPEPNLPAIAEQVAAQCQQALSTKCTCDKHQPIEGAIGLREFAEYHQNKINRFLDIRQELPPRFPPLDVPKQTWADNIGQDQGAFPFRQLLSATADAPKLDLSLSDLARDGSTFDETLDVRYDFDSLIAPINTLGVFKGGAAIQYRPNYFSSIDQNQYVTVDGCVLNQHKNIQFAVSPRSEGYNIFAYIFWRDLVVHSSNALSSAEMKVWTDDILVPSIREACDMGVQQRHYRSWQQVLNRSGVKTEMYLKSREGGDFISLRKDVPEDQLDALWQAIVRRCNAPHTIRYDHEDSGTAPAARPFQNPILVLIGHDIKTKTRYSEPQSGERVAEELMSQIFFYTPENFRQDHLWLDWGQDITPNRDGYILIRKSACLKSAAELFMDQTTTHLKTQSFLWAGTRDGGSLTIAPQDKNPLYAHLTLGKFYNVIKDATSSPIKGWTPFGQERLPMLSITEAMIHEIYEANSQFGTPPAGIAEKLLGILNETKEHYADSWDENMSAGIRAEFRTTRYGARALARSARNGITTTTRLEDGEHLPFYILRTTDVIAFIKSSLNRWLALVESIALFSRRPEFSGSSMEDVSRMQLMIHTPTLVASLHALQLIFDGDVIKHHKLWKKQVRLDRRPTQAVTEAGGENVATDPRFQGREAPRFGAGLQETTANFGVIYLQDDMINWQDDPPRFKKSLLPELALDDVVEFLGGFQHGAEAMRTLGSRGKLNELIDEVLQHAGKEGEARTSRVLATLAEICVAAYSKTIIAQLKKYWIIDNTSGLTGAALKKKLKELDDLWLSRANVSGHYNAEDMLNGFYGLCPRMICRLLGRSAAAFHMEFRFKAARKNGLDFAQELQGPFVSVTKDIPWENRVLQALVTKRPSVEWQKVWPKCNWREKQEFANTINTITKKITQHTKKGTIARFEQMFLPRIAARWILILPVFEELKWFALAGNEPGQPARGKIDSIEWWIPIFNNLQDQKDYESIVRWTARDDARLVRETDLLLKKNRTETKRYFLDRIPGNLCVWKGGKLSKTITNAIWMEQSTDDSDDEQDDWRTLGIMNRARKMFIELENRVQLEEDVSEIFDEN